MSRRFIVFVSALALASYGGLCGPGPGIPDPDACEGASSDATAAAIEVGGPGDPFTPFAEAQTVVPEMGSQGGTMLPIRIRLDGADLPDCIAQRTTIADAVGNVFLENTTALRTYPDGAMRATRAHYLVFDSITPDPGSWITVTVEALGASTSQSMWLTMPHEGPEMTSLSAPANVAVGEAFELGVSLDGPITTVTLPVFVRASDPAVVEVASQFFVAPTGEPITLPARAIGPGTVEIRAASGRAVQTVSVTVGSPGDADAGL